MITTSLVYDYTYVIDSICLLAYLCITFVCNYLYFSEIDQIIGISGKFEK